MFFTPTNSLIFNGGYARFKLWDTAGLKSLLSFKFKTGKASGLMFYFDDGGINDGFMCLQMQKGKIYLRYKASRRETQHELVAENEDPESPQKGFSSSFADNKWHLVVVQRDRGRVRLAVDKGMSPDRNEWMEYYSVGSDGIELKSATSLYFGGIPKTFRVTDLSLPAAKWTKPFYGEIEKTQIDYVDLNVIQSENVVMAEELLCTKDDPCHNGGKCRVVNGEQRCECPMYYQGDLCEKRKLGVKVGNLESRKMQGGSQGGKFADKKAERKKSEGKKSEVIKLEIRKLELSKHKKTPDIFKKLVDDPVPLSLKSPAPNPFGNVPDVVIGKASDGKNSENLSKKPVGSFVYP